MSPKFPTPSLGILMAFGALALVFPDFAEGQTTTEEGSVSSRVERMDVMNRISDSALSTQAAFATPSPGDEDLGEQLLLTDTRGYRSLTLYGSATEYYTTNASLVDDHLGSDWFTLLQAGLLWVPHLGGNFYGELSARQDLFRYARHSELSFNSTNLGAGLTYVFRQLGDLSLAGRYGFNLLTDASSSSQIYREQFLKFSLQKPFVLSRAHFLFTGISAQLVLEGTPDFALRDQFLWFAGYQANLTRSLSLNTYFQLGYMPFREGGRSDWNQILSGAITWNAWRWFSVSALVSASFNSSNESFYNYSVLNLGGGINGSIQF